METPWGRDAGSGQPPRLASCAGHTCSTCCSPEGERDLVQRQRGCRPRSRRAVQPGTGSQHLVPPWPVGFGPRPDAKVGRGDERQGRTELPARGSRFLLRTRDRPRLEPHPVWTAVMKARKYPATASPPRPQESSVSDPRILQPSARDPRQHPFHTDCQLPGPLRHRGAEAGSAAARSRAGPPRRVHRPGWPSPEAAQRRPRSPETSAPSRVSPGAQHHLPFVDGEQSPAPVPRQLRGSAWPQTRIGQGRVQHRFWRHPRHAPCLPPWRAALRVLRAEHLLLGNVLFTSSLITVCGAAWTGCQCLLSPWAVRSSRGRPVCLGFGITCALTGRR